MEEVLQNKSMEILENNLLSIQEHHAIVDLDMLGKYLAQCVGCEKPLDIRNSLGFRNVQVSGMLFVACLNESCMKVNKIPLTSLSESDKETYAVDDTFVSAVLKAGLSGKQIHALFSALRLPLNYTVPEDETRVKVKEEIDYDAYGGFSGSESERGLPGATDTELALQGVVKRRRSKRKRKRVVPLGTPIANEAEKPYICTVCEKPFMRKSDMVRHEGTHSGVKPYNCEVCNKTFTRKSSLEIHSRVHTGAKPYGCVKCNKTFMTRARQRYHINHRVCEQPIDDGDENETEETFAFDESIDKVVVGKTPEEKLYVCGACCRVFPSQTELETHKRMHRKTSRPFTCSVCNKSYFYLTSLQKHMSMHSGQASWACIRCKDVFMTKKGLKDHERGVHGVKTFGCKNCLDSFDTKTALRVHNRTTHPKPGTLLSRPDFSCIFCDHKFDGEMQLREHLATHTTNMVPKEASAPGSSINPENLSLEARTPGAAGDTLSPEMSLSLTEIEKIISQVSATHAAQATAQGQATPQAAAGGAAPGGAAAAAGGDNPTLNDLRINNLSDLTKMAGQTSRSIMQAMAGNKMIYKCLQCEETFTRQYELKRHQLHHLGIDQIHSCDICGKKFNRINSLKVHIISVHVGERPYQCSDCGARFKRRNALNTHRYIHNPEKRFKCHYCPSGFIRKEALEEHIRVHTREKPFICTYCAKAFPSKKSLRHHERYHTGEKLYQCHYCEKKFARTYTRMVHERTHTGEKPYQCCVCSRYFALKKSCELHEKRCSGFTGTTYGQEKRVSSGYHDKRPNTYEPEKRPQPIINEYSQDLSTHSQPMDKRIPEYEHDKRFAGYGALGGLNPAALGHPGLGHPGLGHPGLGPPGLGPGLGGLPGFGGYGY